MFCLCCPAISLFTAIKKTSLLATLITAFVRSIRDFCKEIVLTKYVVNNQV